jgi:hypothetical protein
MRQRLQNASIPSRGTLIRDAIVLTPPRFVRNGIIPIFRVFATKVLTGRKRWNYGELN